MNLFEWPWKENKAARGRSLVPPILWCPKHYLYKPVRSIRFGRAWREAPPISVSLADGRGACENSLLMNSTPVLLAGGSLAAAGVFAWAAVAPSSQLFGPTIRMTGASATLALTFDDGPNPAVTPALLDLLSQYEAHATFFQIGERVRAFPAISREVAQRGHTLGNHTDTHPRLTFLSPRRIREEVARCDDALAAATGQATRWMRPPYGYRGPQLEFSRPEPE